MIISARTARQRRGSADKQISRNFSSAGYDKRTRGRRRRYRYVGSELARQTEDGDMLRFCEPTYRDSRTDQHRKRVCPVRAQDDGVRQVEEEHAVGEIGRTK